jgi:hypothetical protein
MERKKADLGEIYDALSMDEDEPAAGQTALRPQGDGED